MRRNMGHLNMPPGRGRVNETSAENGMKETIDAARRAHTVPNVILFFVRPQALEAVAVWVHWAPQATCYEPKAEAYMLLAQQRPITGTRSGSIRLMRE